MADIEPERESQVEELPEPEVPAKEVEHVALKGQATEEDEDAEDVPPETPDKTEQLPVLSSGEAGIAANADTPTRPSQDGSATGVFQEISLSGSDVNIAAAAGPAGANTMPARQGRESGMSPTAPAVPGSSNTVTSPAPSSSSNAAPSMRRSSTTYSVASTSRGSIAASRKPLLQGVLVINAFESILNSKDAKRIPTLKASAQRALDILKNPQGTATNANEDRREEVFEPLKLACQTKTNALMITALDTIGKLVSYGFFNPPHANVDEDADNSPAQDADESFVRDAKSEQLSDTVVDAICDCFIETPSGPAVAALQAAANSATTPDAVNLQIVKALLTLVLQDANGQGLTVHQSSLVGAFAQTLRLR